MPCNIFYGQIFWWIVILRHQSVKGKMLLLQIAAWTFLILPYYINATGSEHEKIVKWWNKISEKKPYKCEVNAQYLQPFHPEAQKFTKELKGEPWFITKPCEEDDLVFVEHTFKGNVTNGQIYGPGKLKILGSPIKYQHGELKGMNKTCFINTAGVKEVVGSFVNGTISGPAKVSLKNGNVIISTFVNGTPLGPKRLWISSQEKLNK